MKKLFTYTLTISLFCLPMFLSGNAYGWIYYSYWQGDHTCAFACGENGGAFTLFNGADSYGSCEDAAADQCGDGNFEIQWQVGFPFHGYELQKVVTPEGEVILGKEATEYLQKRYVKKEGQR